MQTSTAIRPAIENADRTSAAQHRTSQPSRPWLQDAWLWILLLGPVIAPLFLATGLPVFRPFADGIYLLGALVCPKPDMHFMVLDLPVAVCSSCWMAVFGLWAVRLLYGRAGEGFGPLQRPGVRALWSAWHSTPLDLRLAVTLLAFLPWAVDVMLWDAGIWASPHLFMMLAGFLGGVGAALLLFPTAAAMRVRLARS